MKVLLLVPFVCLTLAGCAGMDAAQCRSAGWYDVGFRDGLFGMQTQSNVYEDQCTRHGTKIDSARYAEGWQHGYWELQTRRSASGHD
jgi:hypothetical protein